MNTEFEVSRHHVNSTCIRSIGYSALEMVLEIEFNTGTVYRYFDVSLHAYSALCASQSKGAHVARNIRSSYPFKRMR